MKRHPQGILVTCEVPWDDRENLMDDVFRQEVAYLAAAGFRELYIFGTAGEGYAIDNGGFREVTELFLQETARQGVSAQVGVIGLSTVTVIERVGIAWDLGCRSFQISLPSWGALNDRELLGFFRSVCGSFPDSSFLHYNLDRAKRVLRASDYRSIVGAVPNLVATKNTGVSIAEARELITDVPELQHHLSEAMFPTGCAFGDCSLLSSFGPLLPEQTRLLFEFGRTRQWDLLMPHWKRYMDVISAFLKPLEGEARIDGAYDKMIMRLAGTPMPLHLLSPYQGYTEEELGRCYGAITKAAPDWFNRRDFQWA